MLKWTPDIYNKKYTLYLDAPVEDQYGSWHPCTRVVDNTTGQEMTGAQAQAFCAKVQELTMKRDRDLIPELLQNLPDSEKITQKDGSETFKSRPVFKIENDELVAEFPDVKNDSLKRTLETVAEKHKTFTRE